MSRSSLRILFISHDAGRTGAPIGLLAFQGWLRANTNHTFGTILRKPGVIEPAFRELGPTLTLGTSRLLRSRLGRRLHRLLPADFREERKAIRRMGAAGRYDVIVSNTMTNGAVLETLAPLQIPVVTHVHELDYWISRAGEVNLRQVLAHSSAYIAVAQAVRENLVRNHGIPADKVALVYEHIRELPKSTSPEEKRTARQALGIPDGAFVVGGCGAEHWRKGRDLIPQVLIELRRRESSRPCHFVWIGRPGTAEEEYALRHDLRAGGVEGRFHTSREVANPFALFPAIDVFALLSRDDPYPLACLEVAATETPVVCFEGAGGMPEFVRDGCGFVAPYLDIATMANDVLKLAAQPELARDMGRRARAKVARENLLETTGPKLVEAIEREVARR